MNSKRSLAALVIAAIVILAVGEGYLVFSLQHLGGGSSTVAGTAPSEIAASAPAPATPAPNSALMPLSGIVTSTGSGYVMIGNPTSTSTTPQRIAIDSATTIVEEGAPKSQAQQDSDMAGFRTQTEILMQDPQKNQAELARLVAPSPYTEQTLTAADLVAGQSVTLYVDGAADAPHAVLIQAEPTHGT